MSLAPFQGDYQPAIEIPGVIHVLEVVAWVTVSISLLCAAFGVFAEAERYLVGGGLMCAFGGCLLVVFCLAVRKLYEIEHHLRARRD